MLLAFYRCEISNSFKTSEVLPQKLPYWLPSFCKRTIHKSMPLITTSIWSTETQGLALLKCLKMSEKTTIEGVKIALEGLMPGLSKEFKQKYLILLARGDYDTTMKLRKTQRSSLKRLGLPESLLDIIQDAQKGAARRMKSLLSYAHIFYASEEIWLQWYLLVPWPSVNI